MESMAINAELGGRILDAFPEMSVDVHKPDVTIHIEIRGRIYIYSEILPGTGGMPLGTASTVGIVNGGYSLARGGAAQVYGIARKLTGTADNKETTRNDMAIMMIDRMSEVGNSDIWTQTAGFKNGPELDTVNPKTIVRQGRNVSQLHNVLRRGLDADMPELISAPSKAELRKKIAASFGQE